MEGGAVKGVSFEEFGGKLEVVELPEPAAGAGDVIVKVRAVGLCRSDWHAWQGHDSDVSEEKLPHVLGHEFAGEIAEVGRGVESLYVGQRVTAPFVCGCGKCFYCEGGNAQVCPDQYQPGFHGPGAFAEYVRVPRAGFNVIPLEDDVEFRDAAALGCRFATAYRALVHRDQAAVCAGEWVVVFGCGGVGLSAVTIAKSVGANVVAVDIRQEALEAATDLGADLGFEPDQLSDRFLDLNGGEGPDVTVDALGNAEVARNAIDMLRPLGRHVQVGLLVGEDADPKIPMGRVIAKELRIIGSHGMSAASYPEMLAKVAAGNLRPAAMVGAEIGMEAIPSAMEAMGTFDGRSGLTVATFLASMNDLAVSGGADWRASSSRVIDPFVGPPCF